MKSKKLLIALTVIAVIIVIIVVLAAILTVKKVAIVYHGFDGAQVSAPDSGISSDEILSKYKGKSIIFLSKSKLMSELNVAYDSWHAFAVIKHFPNELEIHFVARTAIAKFSAGGQMYYVDSFGYAAPAPAVGDVIDISSAFQGQGLEAKSSAIGTPFEFESSVSNVRLRYVLDSILATWQCLVDIDNMQSVLGDGGNVFTFDEDENLVISPKTGGRIIVQSPETDLSERLIKAYGVYYNGTLNVQEDSYTVTVYKNGTVTTSSK